MKPFLFVVAVATALLTICTSFSFEKKASPAAAVAGSALLKDNTHYYWYLSGDVYDGYFTTSDEINRLEETYGVIVDTNPSGATLLSRGYVFYGTPHLVWPSVYLYGHF